MFNKDNAVQAVAWAATGVAIIVAMVITKSAWPLVAFAFPFCLTPRNKGNQQNERKGK